MLHSYTTTRLYTHANCIPNPLESQSLTAPPSVSSIHCRTTHLHGFPHTSLRGYATTPLHHYRATRLPSSRHGAKQRGARNGTPQDSCLLLSFLPAPFGYATIELRSYTATWLREYAREEETIHLRHSSISYSYYSRSDPDSQHQATRLHIYVPAELHGYRHRQLHAYVRIMPKERRHQKGAPFNETGSPPPNSYRPPRYACQSTS